MASTVTRRPLPALIALLALLAADRPRLVAGAAPRRPARPPSPTCPTPSASTTAATAARDPAAAVDRQVTVLNATTRSGIAGKAPHRAVKRRLQVPTAAGNDRHHRSKIAGVAADPLRPGGQARPRRCCTTTSPAPRWCRRRRSLADRRGRRSAPKYTQRRPAARGARAPLAAAHADHRLGRRAADVADRQPSRAEPADPRSAPSSARQRSTRAPRRAAAARPRRRRASIARRRRRAAQARRPRSPPRPRSARRPRGPRVEARPRSRRPAGRRRRSTGPGGRAEAADVGDRGAAAGHDRACRARIAGVVAEPVPTTARASGTSRGPVEPRCSPQVRRRRRGRAWNSLAGRRVAHRAGDHRAVDLGGDRHRVLRQAEDEVDRAVDRVEHPAHPALPPAPRAALLAEHAVVRAAPRELGRPATARCAGRPR